MKHVIYARPVTLAMPWSERTVVVAYATTAGWNAATVTAVNVSVKKMLSASNVIAAHPIITVSVLATVAGYAIATWLRRAANVMEKRDNASVCLVSPVADATSAFRDIGIMDQMDAHVRLSLLNYYLSTFINILSKVYRLWRTRRTNIYFIMNTTDQYLS